MNLLAPKRAKSMSGASSVNKSPERAKSIPSHAMPQSIYKVYTRTIISTKHKKNLIDDKIENDLFN
jgi:hypothetical protein